MDDSFNRDSLDIYSAALLTFGYDTKILNFDPEIVKQKMGIVTIYKTVTKCKSPFDISQGLISCCPEYEKRKLEQLLSKNKTVSFREKGVSALKALKNKILDIKANKRGISESFSDLQIKKLSGLLKFKTYSSQMKTKFQVSDLFDLLFAEEYSLLKKGIKNAIVGTRSIGLSSIMKDGTKKSYLKKLFSKINKNDMFNYAYLFLKERGFNDVKVNWLKIAHNKISRLINIKSKEKKVFYIEDIDTRIDNHKKNKEDFEDSIRLKFSKKLLDEVDINKISSCRSICVQNMDTIDEMFEPLSDEKQEELRNLCYLYAGRHFTLMNGLLRGKVHPIFDNDRLEKIINACNKKIKESEKYLKIYEPHGYGNSYIIPLDIYKKIEDACHNFAKLVQEGEKSGPFWRNVGVRGIKTTLQGKYKDKAEKYFSSDEFVRKKIEFEGKTFIEEVNNNLKGALLVDKAFLSTSLSDSLNFELKTRSIVLKITGENVHGLLIEFSDHKQEKEFLLPPNTKLKIDTISECEDPYLAKKAIQINCAVV